MQPQTENVDQVEIAKFAAIADQWWNPYGSCKPLHDINPLRLDFIKRYTSFVDLKILDVGCGGGILTESMAAAGGQVVGIDLCEQAIQVARNHAGAQGLTIDYQLISAEDFAGKHQAEFDIITCMELLEHVPDPVSLIAACSKLLKPNGHIFFSTINRNLKAYLYAIVGAEYFLRLLPKGTHRYDKFLKPVEMFSMLQKEKLQLAHMAGLSYNAIAKTYYLSQDVSVNYLMHCYKDQAGINTESLD